MSKSRLLLSPVAIANLRQTAMHWALSTCSEGESTETIIARAEAYADFVSHPCRDDVAIAMAERQTATLN